MSWHHYAACVGEDPELFFPVGTTDPAIVQTQQATQICRGCAVRCLCLEWALLAGIDHGVWGGLTENDRRALNYAPVDTTHRLPSPPADRSTSNTVRRRTATEYVP